MKIIFSSFIHLINEVYTGIQEVGVNITLVCTSSRYLSQPKHVIFTTISHLGKLGRCPSNQVIGVCIFIVRACDRNMENH